MRPSFTVNRDQFDGVIAFLRVAERRSFRAAADELGVSPSALSQIIRSLEKRAGAALLTRTTRRVGLTEAGQRFLEHARPAVAGLMSAFESAEALGEEVTGLLRLNVPRPIIAFMGEAILRDFCTAYPKVQVEIFAEDRLANIVEDGFDAGIRLGELIEADMVAVRLSPPFAYTVVGSPGYFERHGRPARPADLRHHRCIRTRRATSNAIYRWEFLEEGRPFEVSVDGPVIVNDPALNITAAAMGLGLAYAAAPMAQARVEQGQLETALDAFCPGTPGLFLYYPSRAQVLPKLRVFIEFARTRLRNGWNGAASTGSLRPLDRGA